MYTYLYFMVSIDTLMCLFAIIPNQANRAGTGVNTIPATRCFESGKLRILRGAVFAMRFHGEVLLSGIPACRRAVLNAREFR